MVWEGQNNNQYGWHTAIYANVNDVIESSTGERAELTNTYYDYIIGEEGNNWFDTIYSGTVYYLASPWSIANEEQASFGLFCVGLQRVDVRLQGIGFGISRSAYVDGVNCKVRAIVHLRSDIQINTEGKTGASVEQAYTLTAE